MLSQKVDLTENSEFSGGNEIFMDTPIEISFDEYQAMTHDEYERLMWWEGIFGRKRHYTQRSEIFDDVGRYYNKWKDHCHKCGEEIRIPWLNFGGVCKHCNSLLEKTKTFPWKIQTIWDNTIYNLFNSR